MSDKIWNGHQQKAISARNKSVVISAAAGSGKTSVLAERVLRLIEEGGDIERMLVVTFTNLAAGEMKERIYLRLQDAGSDPRLAAQAEKCAHADISTIHAFCGRVIRDNFDHAGVSPTFTVADEARVRLIRQSALDQTIEAAMQDKRMHRFFLKFAARGDTEGIKAVVDAIYSRVISQRDPGAWLDAAEKNFDSKEFAAVLFNEYHQMVIDAANSASIHLMARSDIWRIRGFDAEADGSEAERIKLLRAAQNITTDDAALPGIGHIFLPRVKGAPNRESATHENRAAKCFDGLCEYAGGFLARVSEEMKSTAEDGKIFIDLTRAFIKAYAAAKRRKNVLDHDDQIHFALKALSVPDIAQRYRDKYTHVFVDEYQDINDAQNAIINQIRRDGNDFLVGDVKQCIYMFRESNPDLLKARCGALRETGLIEMNTNYRSAPGIIDFINGVMCFMMKEQAGGVDYTGGQRLEAGRDGQGCVEVVLAGRDDGDKLEAEGIEIAGYIKRLVGNGYHYRDIAVLRPEVSVSGKHILKILSDAGIPVISGFESADMRFGEVGVFCNLLSLVDGRVSDIALLSVMRYPYFGFTEPEFAHIRISRRQTNAEDKSFYDAVHTFEENSGLGQKVKSFLDTIAYYRRLSQCLKLSDFLMRLRQEAAFEEYALTSPGAKSSAGAISAFLGAAMKAESLGDALDIADKMGAARDMQSPGEVDGVYLTTIHKSKGLEFPVVMLSGMHKAINKSDAAGSVLVGRALGLGLDIIDEQTRTKRPTLHKKAISRNMKRETISETVRLLYVGMTRAIERLVIFGAGTELKEKWLEEAYAGWQHDAVTYFDLVMPALNMACAADGKDIADVVQIVQGEPVCAQKADRAERLRALFDQAAATAPEDIFAGYAYAADIGVPSKVSVSALKKMGEPETLRPQFPPSEYMDISAAERGTLMHRVLQKIGIGEKSEARVRECVQSMAKEGVIGSQLEEHVDAARIAVFLHSDLAARARKADRCFFEAPFCLNLSAKEAGLADSEERVIVQGVIDMCFIENGNFVIVDYKTDNVDSADIKEVAQKYKVQLDLYGKALERITCLPVKEKYIYYLSAGEAVRLP
ncbi:MAG: UvrD-helicase domain-containing protein [Eubacteriales bacterium]|nr:UvrD-helicase domain-containing protein [Eubacteriales bacterium]